MKRPDLLRLLLILCLFGFYSPSTWAARDMEDLDRGVVAVGLDSGGVYIGWRMLGSDPETIGFNLYRDSIKLNTSLITGSTNFTDPSGSLSSTYTVATVIDGIEQEVSEPVGVWAQQYLTVPLQVPPGVTTPDGVTCSYSPNDASVGDLDGDGQYEIVLKWDPSNSQDNSYSGYTGNVYLDAYEMDGTFLWRIDLGVNIRAGAHYTQFIVYDLDSDGRAEVACRTSDGTVDGTGSVIGDPAADYRQSNGYILTGPEYLTIFDGRTGAALVSTDFYPDRVDVSQWGDGYGNRVDRFLSGIAYLDGEHPSLIMARGYYGPRSGYSARNEICAYNWRDHTLSQVWYFKANTSGPNSDYIGQGCHSLSIADVDADGNDEIIYGACAIDDDGTGLYTTGLGHGDALHVSDMDPDRPGLEVWQCQEDAPYGATFRDAATGDIIFRQTADEDTGRACAGDITADYRGYEVWASTGVHLYSATGVDLGSHSNPINFMVWWDGDLLREFLDSNRISKYNAGTLLTASNCSSNNGSKATPCLSGDILGDWREEVIWRTSDNQSLRIYTTVIPTHYRLPTLMHDSQYRCAIAWQNTAYNQPPHPGFYLGEGMFDGTGGLLREWWTGIEGNPISELTTSSDYPENPTGWSYLPRLEGPVNWDDAYGTRLRGYLVPPADGEYTFWVAADDTAELWLSTDAAPENAALIASLSAWTDPLQWDKYPSQQSASLFLLAGHKYYIELLHKEGNGGDHFAVSWQGPGLPQQIIESDYLMPWVDFTPGELTDDTYINIADLAVFSDHWLQADCGLDVSIDFNGDCIVNGTDFAVIAREWLKGQQISTLQIQEHEAGYVGVYDGSVDSDNAGYTGSGFVNTNNAVDQYIEWSVQAAASGTYDLQWRYANGASSNRTGSVSINGTVQAAAVDFASTGSWTVWNTSSLVTVTLAEGTNTIQLIAETGDGLANIDWIEVTGEFPWKEPIETLEAMRLANDYFMAQWPDPGQDIITDKVRPSNIWTRATYYEGLMALYAIDPQQRYYDYAVNWGQSHDWNMRSGSLTRNADDQCCGQTYIDLYLIDPQPERIQNIKTAIDAMVNSTENDDWWWIDALQMAMPVFARLGALYEDDAYFEKMYQIYLYTKQSHGTNGLYNPVDHLWWRDADFDPPYTEPNGEDCYWSRGNGWVFAALTRVLDVMPENAPHRREYVQTLQEMAGALATVQRPDGFWNVSLHDPDNYGGKETSGTAFFTYGLAWGINHGVLDASLYQPVVERAWDGLVNDSLHPDGFLGYVQGTGKQPSDSQPVGYDIAPNFEDFGLGAFLLAGRQVYEMRHENP